MRGLGIVDISLFLCFQVLLLSGQLAGRLAQQMFSWFKSIFAL
jgi:hypothetical protein